jgi:hypothetical protein
VQRLAQQLRESSGKNALVSPQLSSALGAAQRQMAQARDAVASSNPNAREAADRAGDALDALNAAAHGLLRARGDVSGSQSGSGLAEAMQRMQQMAGQQGQLSQDAAGMLPMMGGAGGQPDQMAQLAQRQRALAEQLERMRGQGNMPGAGELSNEAAELAKRLEAGRLDRGTVERQERLFRRMLDAGRTLQGEKEDERKERESTTATGDSVRIPPALRRQLEDEAGRVRLPTWEELQRPLAGGAAYRGGLFPPPLGAGTVMRAVLFALLLAAPPLAAQADSLARAFEMERRGNFAGAIPCSARPCAPHPET